MPIRRVPVGSLNSFYYQSPHLTDDLNPEPALVAALASAKSTLYFAAYSFTLPSVAAAIIAARDRGVEVLGVVDASSIKGSTSQVPALVRAGINVRRWGSTWRLMHDKVFVVDGATKNAKAGLGSFNWTTQAEKNNTEVLLICTGTQVSRGLAGALESQIRLAHDTGSIIDL